MSALTHDDVGEYLNRHFVSAFQKVATFRVNGVLKLGGNVASYFCTPDGLVLHAVAGPTRLYQKSSYSGVVLDDIGLERPKSQSSTDPELTMLDVSPEQIDKAEADLIFVTVADEPDKTQKKDVTSNPVWKDLTAVKDGQVFEVPDETWMSGIGIQAAEHMLADVAKATGVELPEK